MLKVELLVIFVEEGQQKWEEGIGRIVVVILTYVTNVTSK
jgi:hypothetical protein